MLSKSQLTCPSPLLMTATASASSAEKGTMVRARRTTAKEDDGQDRNP